MVSPASPSNVALFIQSIVFIFLVALICKNNIKKAKFEFFVGKLSSFW
jgi:hypothetical protein